MRHALRILAIALVLVAALVYFSWPQKYQMVHPHRGDLNEAVYGLGKVKANHRYEVVAGVISTVERRFVKEGDFVLKGAPLIELESRALFRAPFSGTVTLVASYESETVIPHVPVLRLEDLNDRYIELSLEQQAALRVKKAQEARVSFESLRGEMIKGKVTALFPRGDEFLADIAVEHLDSSVLPGMTADVTIEIGKISGALLIPLRALQNGLVTVRRGHRWVRERIQVGHVDGIYAEVLGDTLKPEDELRIRAEE